MKTKNIILTGTFKNKNRPDLFKLLTKFSEVNEDFCGKSGLDFISDEARKEGLHSDFELFLKLEDKHSSIEDIVKNFCDMLGDFEMEEPKYVLTEVDNVTVLTISIVRYI
jgi:hypothetical protein